MAMPIDPSASNLAARLPSKAASTELNDERSDINKRFEQMLWAEMLSHTGLEEALTKSGGKAASAFTQFVIEAIAADLAEQHPLGLDPIPEAAAAYTKLDREGE